MDGVHSRSARFQGNAAQTAVVAERPVEARRLRRVGGDKCVPPTPAGLRGGDDLAADWRFHIVAGAAPCRSGAEVLRRQHPHDGRTEPRVPLGGEKDLPELYRELKAIGLGDFGAGTILDVVACPGTDTCKLGIASSRGLARELRQRLADAVFHDGCGGEGVAHQDERVLQLLRPAPSGRHRFLWKQPHARQSQGAALPGVARRQVARQRRARTASPSARCRRGTCPRWSSASRSDL